MKEIFAHFPPFGKNQEYKKEEQEITVPTNPKRGATRLGRREVLQREMYIPAGWYTYDELIRFATDCDSAERNY